MEPSTKRKAPELEPTERTRIRRHGDRGVYERRQIYAILDEGLICHVAFAVEGRPYILPMAYARLDDTLLLHGSVASRLMQTLAGGVEACVSVTLLDGLVLARSAFSHSMNYRSVVVFGRLRALQSKAEKRRALDVLVEHLVPGRTEHSRRPTPRELAATEVLTLPLEEASAKVRSGPPQDKEEDLALPVWAGVIPLCLTPRTPVSAPDVAPDIPTPDYASFYRRPGTED